jgi:hypothetical protein
MPTVPFGVSDASPDEPPSTRTNSPPGHVWASRTRWISIIAFTQALGDENTEKNASRLRVDLPAVVRRESGAHHLMVRGQNLRASSVAHPPKERRRAFDVGEQEGERLGRHGGVERPTIARESGIAYLWGGASHSTDRPRELSGR